MASQTEIINYALTLLGASRVMSIDDDVKPAREMKAVFAIARDALLSGYDWSFAKARGSLPALSVAPAFGFSNQYQIPVEALRLVMINDHYAGVDLTNYRSAPTGEYTIEGRKILTNLAAPLKVAYIERVDDVTQMTSTFVEAFAAKLAAITAESLTQSSTKKADMNQMLRDAISTAIRSNAIELPPQKFPDDEWLLSRL